MHTSCDPFPLTHGQLQIHRMLARIPEMRASTWTTYRLTGPMDVGALASAVAGVVRRHDALRLGVSDSSVDPPVQWVREMPSDQRLITLQQVRAESLDQFGKYVRHVVAGSMRERWDLTEDYPFKFFLLRYSDALIAFLSGFSLMALDGSGKDIVLRDLWSSYRAGEEGRTEPRSFAEAARAMTKAGTRSRRSLTPAERPGLELRPGHAAGTSGPPHLGELTLAGLPLARLRRLIRASEFTEFQWMLALLAGIVFRFALQDRIRFSVVSDLRGRAEEDLAGMFAVEVPIIVDRPAPPSGNPSLPHVKQRLFEAMLAYKRSDAGAISGGTCAQECLTVSYRQLGRQPHKVEPAGVERDAYCPAVTYGVNGIRTDIVSTEDAVRFRLAFEGQAIHASAAQEFVTRFRHALTYISDDAAASLMDDGRRLP